MPEASFALPDAVNFKLVRVVGALLWLLAWIWSTGTLDDPDV